jgi:hypothetical protein
MEAFETHALVVIGSERDGRPGFVVLEWSGRAVYGTELRDLYAAARPIGCDNEFRPTCADEFWPTSRLMNSWSSPIAAPLVSLPRVSSV